MSDCVSDVCHKISSSSSRQFFLKSLINCSALRISLQEFTPYNGLLVMKDVDSISEDVLVQILLWLPAISLLRFKSVCKSWYHLIKNSYFISQHYRHRHFRLSLNSTSFKEGNGDLFFFNTRDFFESQHPSYACLLSAHKSTLLDLPNIDDPFKFHPVEMVASCNGIICLRQNRSVCLWNPVTKQATNLPSLPVVPIDSRFFIGFGFDLKSNDYKLICCSLDVDSIHLYSSRSNFWRIVRNDSWPPLFIMSELRTPYRSEVYCCLGYRDYAQTICTFDFGTEVFGSIPLPDSVETDSVGTSEELAILRGNIACIRRLQLHNCDYYADTSSKSFRYEIWMLNDYEIKESWTKLYTIGPSSYWTCMTGFSMNGDFLLFQDKTRLCLYDLVSQDTMHLPVDVNCRFKAVVYEESLICMERGNGAATRVTLPDQAERMLVSELTAENNIFCGVDIPDDVVVHILLCLPVASVLRFMSVCKSWHSLIGSSDFVVQHLHRHRHRDDNFILLNRNPNDYQLFEDPSHLSRSVSFSCLLSANKFELLDFPFDDVYWGDGQLKILASCNGIICFQQSEYWNVYLWNPATKQFRAIMEQPQTHHESWNDSAVGFGFDVKTNDYKVVQFDSSLVSEIRLYSLRTNSWKVIELKAIDDRLTNSLSSIAFNPQFYSLVDSYGAILTPFQGGVFCWFVTISFTKMILTFNFSTEAFGIIQLPHITNSYSHLKLEIVREKIALLVLNDVSEIEDWQVELWVLNEYGPRIQESWTKLYKIGPFSGDWSLGMVYSNKNGDFIVLPKDGQLCWCDLATGETKNIHVHLQDSKQKKLIGGSPFQAVLYKESLVSITRGHHIMSKSPTSAI